jgi:hypothetical protein
VLHLQLGKVADIRFTVEGLGMRSRYRGKKASRWHVGRNNGPNVIQFFADVSMFQAIEILKTFQIFEWVDAFPFIDSLPVSAACTY